VFTGWVSLWWEYQGQHNWKNKYEIGQIRNLLFSVFAAEDYRYCKQGLGCPTSSQTNFLSIIKSIYLYLQTSSLAESTRISLSSSEEDIWVFCEFIIVDKYTRLTEEWLVLFLVLSFHGLDMKPLAIWNCSGHF
jgi:hypothetical protein